MTDAWIDEGKNQGTETGVLSLTRGHRYPADQIFTLRLITVAKLQLHEELYKRVEGSGRLRTTGIEEGEPTIGHSLIGTWSHNWPNKCKPGSI